MPVSCDKIKTGPLSNPVKSLNAKLVEVSVLPEFVFLKFNTPALVPFTPLSRLTLKVPIRGFGPPELSPILIFAEVELPFAVIALEPSPFMFRLPVI